MNELIEKLLKEFTDKYGLDCSNCNNVGWYSGTDFTHKQEDRFEEPQEVQVQCEFCYTEPRSKFNLENDLKELLKANPLGCEVMPKIAETLHKDLEIEMYGKIIKGMLNGEQVSEQWINVNNAVFIAKKYMAKVESNFTA